MPALKTVRGSHKPGNAGGHRRLEGQGTDSPCSLWRECRPGPTLNLASEADLGLLASRTVREYIFVILNHHIHGNFYGSHKDLIGAAQPRPHQPQGSVAHPQSAASHPEQHAGQPLP